MRTNNPGATNTNTNGYGAALDDPAHDPIVIAAKFTAELYRQCGVVVDVEVVCNLLTRFRLESLSTIKEDIHGSP